jgi:hypothetical protein
MMSVEQPEELLAGETEELGENLPSIHQKSHITLKLYFTLLYFTLLYFTFLKMIILAYFFRLKHLLNEQMRVGVKCINLHTSCLLATMF